MAKIKIAPPVTLSQLAQTWLEAKAAEENARQHRIALEEEIENLVSGPEEGSATATEDHYKITVTRKYTRTIDLDAYEQVKSFVPSNIIRYEPKLDMKIYRAIETANPAAFTACQKFVTVKPAKTAVKIEEVE